MTIVKLTLDQHDGVTVASTGHTNSTVMPDGVVIDFDGVLTLNGVEIPSPLALRSGWANRGIAAQSRVESLAGPAAATPDDEDAVTAHRATVGELTALSHAIELFDRCEREEFPLTDLPSVMRDEPAPLWSETLSSEAPGDVAERESFTAVMSGLTAEAATTCGYEWQQW
jgi:hypothetical protein